MVRKSSYRITDYVSSIVENYKEHPDTSYLGMGDLPDRDEIITIIFLLRELLFPGYFGKKNLVIDTIEYSVGELLIKIHDKLYDQICSALEFQARKDKENNPDISAKADEIIDGLLEKITYIRNILATDVQAAFDGDPAAAGTDEIIFSYPGIFAISVYRLAHELYLLSVPLIPRIMTEYAHNVTGIDIHAGATIGSHFFIDHGTGIVIGETAVIGNHVKIYQSVTLGALSTRGGQFLRGTKRHPTIENNVTIYAGASILGGETVIGEDVAIGSNVFITKSVPERTRVSVKNPELQYKNQTRTEFRQEAFLDWVI
jgi:serine O-acetyltransferase